MKFRVVISGEDVEVKVRSRRWLFFFDEQTLRTGFFTTRFIEAENEEEAVESVLRTVKRELNEMGRLNRGTGFEIENVREDSAGFDKYAPGGGFTFWKE